MRTIIFNFFLTSLICSFLSSSAQLPAHEWARQFGQSGSQLSEARSIIADATGNVYVTGSFTGTHDFDPGPAVYNLTSAAGADIFILKMDASGNLLWVNQIAGATGDDIATGIALSPSGDVLVTGGFSGAVDFDPGIAVNLMTAQGFLSDIFILNLNTNGNFIWVKQVGGTQTDISAAIALDFSGNILVTGIFMGSVDFDPGPAVANVSSVSTADNFILSLNADGIFKWVKQVSGPSVTILPQSLKADANGNIISAGFFTGNCDFDPGAAAHILSSTNGYAAYILKLDSTGNFVWDAMFKGSSNVYARSLDVDAAGSIYSTGSFDFTADFDPGVSVFNLAGSFEKGFVSKLDNAGNFVWARSIADVSRSIALDNTGAAYIIGSSVSQSLTKLSNSGNEEWVQYLNSPSNSGSIIYVDELKNIYTASSFSGTKDFDPGAGIFELTATAPFEIYVRKLSQLQVVPVRFISFTGIYTRQGVQLNWHLAGEPGVSSSNFIVERSEEGIRFTALPGLIVSGNGEHYSCIDPTAPNSNNFYRIRYTGAAAGMELSKIITLNAGPTDLRKYIWVTTEGKSLTIYSTEPFKNASIRVFDINAKMLLNKNNSRGNVISLDMHLVPNAIYILELRDENRKFVARFSM